MLPCLEDPRGLDKVREPLLYPLSVTGLDITQFLTETRLLAFCKAKLRERKRETD